MQRLLRLPARAAFIAAPQTARPSQLPSSRFLAGSSSRFASTSSSQGNGSGPPAAEPDGVAEGKALGRTGGGEPLESSKNAPPLPKIHNATVPGEGMGLSEEQQAEVDKHNRDFDKKHDRAENAPGDKVDKEFWKGGGNRGKKAETES